MPGRPVPRRAADLVAGTDPQGRTQHALAPTRGGQREASRTDELTDRRLNQRRPQREPVWVQPDQPGHAVGRAWLDLDSTAENP